MQAPILASQVGTRLGIRSSGPCWDLVTASAELDSIDVGRPPLGRPLGTPDLPSLLTEVSEGDTV